ncbi:MAG: phenylalanine--tRNA ligase subunit beta, partial [Thermoprotei archaeon]
ITPELREDIMRIEINYINKLLGTSLTSEKVVKHLKTMRFEASAEEKNSVRVIIPPYRVDILHPADIVEEIAMSIGYDNLGPQPIPNYLPAKRPRRIILVNHLRELLIGLGFQEVMTLVLMSSDFVKKVFKGEVDVLEVLNPLSLELSCVRTSLLPGIMAVFGKSQYAEMPVRVFEIGYVVTKDVNSPTGWRNELRLGIGIMNSEVSFEDIQAPVYAVLRALGLQPQTKIYTHPTLINGRTAKLLVNEKFVGYLGEVHPEVLEVLGIKYPVAIAELNVERIEMVLR